MRIEGVGRMPGGVPSVRSTTGDVGFRLADPDTAAAGPQKAAPRAPVGLDALLALQAVPVETPREKRRRAVARGRGLLDALDGIRFATLSGRDDPAVLAALAARLRDGAETTGDAGLDDALMAIELRASVEMAKRGL